MAQAVPSSTKEKGPSSVTTPNTNFTYTINNNNNNNSNTNTPTIRRFIVDDDARSNGSSGENDMNVDEFPPERSFSYQMQNQQFMEMFNALSVAMTQLTTNVNNFISASPQKKHQKGNNNNNTNSNNNNAIAPATASTIGPLQQQTVEAIQQVEVLTIRQKCVQNLEKQIAKVTCIYLVDSSPNGMTNSQAHDYVNSQNGITTEIKQLADSLFNKIVDDWSVGATTSLQKERDIINSIIEHTKITHEQWVKVNRPMLLCGINSDGWKIVREEFNLDDLQINDRLIKHFQGIDKKNKKSVPKTSTSTTTSTTTSATTPTITSTTSTTQQMTYAQAAASSSSNSYTTVVDKKKEKREKKRKAEKSPQQSSQQTSPQQSQQQQQPQQQQQQQVTQSKHFVKWSKENPNPNPTITLVDFEAGTYKVPGQEKSRCARCGNVGHSAKECRMITDVKCTHCKRTGHYYKACVTRINNPNAKMGSSGNIPTELLRPEFKEQANSKQVPIDKMLVNQQQQQQPQQAPVQQQAPQQQGPHPNKKRKNNSPQAKN
jgi:hypothetical protein